MLEYDYKNTLANPLVAQVVVNDASIDVIRQKTFQSNQQYVIIDDAKLSEH